MSGEKDPLGIEEEDTGGGRIRGEVSNEDEDDGLDFEVDVESLSLDLSEIEQHMEELDVILNSDENGIVSFHDSNNKTTSNNSDNNSNNIIIKELVASTSNSSSSSNNITNTNTNTNTDRLINIDLFGHGKDSQTFCEDASLVVTTNNSSTLASIIENENKNKSNDDLTTIQPQPQQQQQQHPLLPLSLSLYPSPSSPSSPLSSSPTTDHSLQKTTSIQIMSSPSLLPSPSPFSSNNLSPILSPTHLYEDHPPIKFSSYPLTPQSTSSLNTTQFKPSSPPPSSTHSSSLSSSNILKPTTKALPTYLTIYPSSSITYDPLLDTNSSSDNFLHSSTSAHKISNNNLSPFTPTSSSSSSHNSTSNDDSGIVSNEENIHIQLDDGMGITLTPIDLPEDEDYSVYDLGSNEFWGHPSENIISTGESTIVCNISNSSDEGGFNSSMSAFSDSRPSSRGSELSEGVPLLSYPKMTKLSNKEELWMKILSNWHDLAARDDNLVRSLVRSIPATLRGLLWRTMSGSVDLENKNRGVYETLYSQASPHDEKISKDIPRTFPSDPLFCEQGSVGQLALHRLLRAFTVLDSVVGYCQGMSFIAAHLLFVMDEEHAFWVFVSLMKQFQLSGLFANGLPLLRQCLYILDRLMETHLPKLFSYFKFVGVTPLLFASEWFSTLYTYNFPQTLSFKIWDVLLLSPTNPVRFMLQLSLALLKLCQAELLVRPFEEVVECLKSKGQVFSAELIFRAVDTVVLSQEEIDKYMEEFVDTEGTEYYM